MGPILLATDGSKSASEAATRAIELAEELGEPLHVVSVVDSRKYDETALGTANLATVYAEDHASLTVSAVREMAGARAIDVEVTTPHGVPDETILQYADDVGATVIVLGEHGDHSAHFSGVGRRVVRSATCEVEVIAVDR